MPLPCDNVNFWCAVFFSLVLVDIFPQLLRFYIYVYILTFP